MELAFLCGKTDQTESFQSGPNFEGFILRRIDFDATYSEHAVRFARLNHVEDLFFTDGETNKIKERA